MFRVLHGLPAVLMLSWCGQTVPAGALPSVDPEAVVSESLDILAPRSPDHGSDRSHLDGVAFIDDNDDEPPLDRARVSFSEAPPSVHGNADAGLAPLFPPTGGAETFEVAAVYLLTERFRL